MKRMHWKRGRYLAVRAGRGFAHRSRGAHISAEDALSEVKGGSVERSGAKPGLPRLTWMRALSVAALALSLAGSAGCVKAIAGVGRDMSNRWYARRLVQKLEGRYKLVFFAASRKKFENFRFEIGTGDPRSAMVDGVN